MNKSQAEKTVYAFHAVFRVNVNDVKPGGGGGGGGSKTLALGFSMAPHLLRALVDFISTGLMIGIGRASI